ncbi:hypothetical protein DICVIV_09398 [Dictyocaulus viviparus]|uniref:RNA helicase n=1 Tax=Dictyocaulus viviparus TaxID=29172 RepID=A0A0D8XJ04_DICVI|nr:hypothetical protein DICVIV_09398 [Dictyocaulus viviparus]
MSMFSKYSSSEGRNNEKYVGREQCHNNISEHFDRGVCRASYMRNVDDGRETVLILIILAVLLYLSLYDSFLCIYLFCLETRGTRRSNTTAFAVNTVRIHQSNEYGRNSEYHSTGHHRNDDVSVREKHNLKMDRDDIRGSFVQRSGRGGRHGSHIDRDRCESARGDGCRISRNEEFSGNYTQNYDDFYQAGYENNGNDFRRNPRKGCKIDSSNKRFNYNFGGSAEYNQQYRQWSPPSNRSLKRIPPLDVSVNKKSGWTSIEEAEERAITGNTFGTDVVFSRSNKYSERTGSTQVPKNFPPLDWVPDETSIETLFERDFSSSAVFDKNQDDCVTVVGVDDYTQIKSWEDSGLHPQLIKTCVEKCNYRHVRPIQAATIPLVHCCCAETSKNFRFTRICTFIS